MKIFYVVDENGIYKSEDGVTRFTRLCGEELYAYLQTPEGSCKVFSIGLDENGDEVGIEIPKEMVKEHYADRDHSRYLKKQEIESGLIFVSIEAELTGVDGEKMTYADIIADEEDEDFIATIQKKADIKTLRKALRLLKDAELDLILNLYLSENPITEEEYSNKIGISQQAVHKRKKCILKKLRSFF